MMRDAFQFEIVFKRGLHTVYRIIGEQLSTEAVRALKLDGPVIAEQVIKTENLLEQLTGYRVHIQQVS